jgi:membrane fusion protein, multidrug efflux system
MKTLAKLLLFIPLLFVHCDSGSGEETENTNNERRVRTVAVETLTMEEDTLEETIQVVGTVEAYNDAVISAEVGGRVQYIVSLGRRVERGEVIARLDDRLLQAGYESARVNYELAVDTYTRQQALYADSIISELQYNSIRTQRDQAKAMYEQAQKQLQDTRIEAPFAGRIEERFTKSGELINPSMPVARLVNTDRVNIVAGIPDRFASDVREGSNSTIYIAGNGTTPYSGTIRFAGNVIDPDTRTYRVEIEIPNPEGTIKPEMVAEVHIVRRTVENTYVIPRTALVRDEDGTNVFVARYEEGQPVAHLVPVRTGATSGLLIQITGGISTGDEVVVSGHRTLNQGDRLEILQNKSSVDNALTLRNQTLSR